MSSVGNSGTAEERSTASEQVGCADNAHALALRVYQQRREAITRRIFERLNSKYRFVAWQDAEDAHADLFPKALSGFRVDRLSAARQDPETATENYLVKAGVNRAIDRYRHERGWSNTAGADAGGKREIPTDPQALLDRADAPVDQLELRARLQAIFSESKQLPEKDRKMFWAYHFKGLKIREIAAEGDVSERWVKKRIALFRTRLEALHGRPAFLPLFVYQLYWRLRDVMTPASTMAAQQEPVATGLAKACAVGCVLIVGGVGAQTAYKQVEKRDQGSKGQATPREATAVPAQSRPTTPAATAGRKQRAESTIGRKHRLAHGRKKARRASAKKVRSAPTPAATAPAVSFPAPASSTPDTPLPAPSESSDGSSSAAGPDVGALDP